jgi:serine/threonine-protein kinase
LDHTSRWRLRVAAGVFIVALVAGTAWMWTTKLAPGAPHPAIDSLVVLPFVNLSSDKENEYFSDGLTEELINTLTTIDGLRVVARTTAFQFKGKAQDIRGIGRQLGVAAVLEGSVRKENTRLRVTAQLNSATDGYHFWSETYDRDLKDVFAIQEEIAQAIHQRVRQKIADTSGRKRNRHTPKLEAYNLYLQGRFHVGRVFGKSMEKAIALYEQAIQMDPDFAEAHAALAYCYTVMGYSHQLPPKEAFPKAVAPIRRALALDDSLSEAHGAKGVISLLFDWDLDEGKRELQRAISLNPSNPFAHHWYSHYLVVMGRFPESLLESKRALELDPLDIESTSHLAWHYDYARDYERAIDAGQKSLELDPNHLPTLSYLESAFEGAGRFDQAIGTLERLGFSSDEGRALREALRTSGAPGYWRARVERAERSSMADPFRMAELYAHLDDADHALQCLDRAFQERHSWLIYLNSDPAFDSVRSHPQFTTLVRKVGLSPVSTPQDVP